MYKNNTKFKKNNNSRTLRELSEVIGYKINVGTLIVRVTMSTLKSENIYNQ